MNFTEDNLKGNITTQCCQKAGGMPTAERGFRCHWECEPNRNGGILMNVQN